MPNVDSLTTIVMILIPLSLAAERVVEIIKGTVPWLNQQKLDPTREGWRNAALQLLAVVAGILTALLARDAIAGALPANWQASPSLGFLTLGLLASGGSGFWNAVLGYVLRLKDVKKLEAEGLRAQQPTGDVLGPIRP
jgi:hypothetical protein